jgi:hypothetical protein
VITQLQLIIIIIIIIIIIRIIIIIIIINIIIFQTKTLENFKTHFMPQNFFLENRAFYEIMGKKMVEPDSRQMAIW